MNQLMETGIKEQIIEKAKEFGACAAGISDVEAIKKSPSHVIYEKIGEYKTVGNKEGEVKPGEISWPVDAKSAVVSVENADAFFNAFNLTDD